MIKHMQNHNITSIIQARVKDAIKNVSTPILIGYSGGADSSVLVHTLYSILGCENIICVHVNHMIRGEEADSDANHCLEYCKKLGIKIDIVKIDVPALAKDKSLEEAARDERYKIFENLSNKYSCPTIALAHTESDNLETVIFNIARGTSLNGLKGIPKERMLGNAKIIRPLINTTRDEILKYCKENELEYVTDNTNSDIAYTRNYIRHTITPKLKNINPRVEDTVSTMCDLVSIDNEYLESVSNDYLKNHIKDGKLNLKDFSSLHYSIASRVIMNYINTSSLKETHIKSLVEYAKEKDTNVCICLPNHKFAYIKNNELFISNEKLDNQNTRLIFTYDIPEEKKVFPEGFIISFENENIDGYHLVGYINVNESDISSIVIRSYRSSDSYFFYKMTRNIKKTASKLSQSERNIRPVFSFLDSVIWYPGYPISSKYDLSTCTKTIYYYEHN